GHAEPQLGERALADRLERDTGDFGHGYPDMQKGAGSTPRPDGSTMLRVQAVLLGAVALHPLALQLAGAANGGGLFAGALLARLLVVAAQLHLAIHAFALQLLLQRAQGLLDIVVADDDLHKPKPPLAISDRQSPRDRRGLHQMIPKKSAPNPQPDRLERGRA